MRASEALRMSVRLDGAPSSARLAGGSLGQSLDPGRPAGDPRAARRGLRGPGGVSRAVRDVAALDDRRSELRSACLVPRRGGSGAGRSRALLEGGVREGPRGGAAVPRAGDRRGAAAPRLPRVPPASASRRWRSRSTRATRRVRCACTSASACAPGGATSSGEGSCDRTETCLVRGLRGSAPSRQALLDQRR